jgi:hypothetical protein
MLRLNKTFYKVPRNRNRRQTFQFYQVGEQVMSRFLPSGKKWYHGIVATVRTIEGLYDIQYNDGDFELGVGPDRLRKIIEECDDEEEIEEEEEEVASRDIYCTDNKKRCNDAIVEACQKNLGESSIQALVIDAGMLNTTTCLIDAGISVRQVDIINRDKKELPAMVENLHSLQKRCTGLLSLLPIESSEYLRRRTQKLNVVFLDYTQTLETIQQWCDVENLFQDTVWMEGTGVFGITFSLRGSETRAIQEGKIKAYLESVVVGRYTLKEEFVKIYGTAKQMLFLLFSVEKVAVMN